MGEIRNRKKTREERTTSGGISLQRRAELNRMRMWYNLRPAIPVVFALCTVLPFWGWWTESSYVRTQRAQMVTDQAMVNDLSRFKIGPSEVHGNGLMTTVDVPKGGTVGLHWFEVKPVPEQDGFVASYTLSFWPPTCTRLPG